ERFHYLSPGVEADEHAVGMVVDLVESVGASLVVIDSVGEAFGLEGLNENNDNEVAPWLRRVARRLADTGAAVGLVDHSTKSSENPLFPSGSKRKRAAITGAQYLVEATRPLTKEHGGQLRLTCGKDRHGNYRRGEAAAVLDFTVY